MGGNYHPCTLQHLNTFIYHCDVWKPSPFSFLLFLKTWYGSAVLFIVRLQTRQRSTTRLASYWAATPPYPPLKAPLIGIRGSGWHMRVSPPPCTPLCGAPIIRKLTEGQWFVQPFGDHNYFQKKYHIPAYTALPCKAGRLFYFELKICFLNCFF